MTWEFGFWFMTACYYVSIVVVLYFFFACPRQIKKLKDEIRQIKSMIQKEKKD